MHRISTAAIERAARWLASQSAPPHHVIPELRRRFGLSAVEAIEAIRQAAKLRRAA
jgi:hypothetical protein